MISLFPYLLFLYYLRPQRLQTPKLAYFGFQFLLAFVFATIPAGIIAKVYYNDILANVDFLHGSAESLLTLTNLLIVEGFRRELISIMSPAATSTEQPTAARLLSLNNSSWSKKLPSASLSIVPVVALGAYFGLEPHIEPQNALSLPTWIIHISSLLEWLGAMALVWKYAEVTGNERWKGLTWGMLPLHTSGLLAVTYHVLYNAPSVGLLVVFQAALTAIGNGCMAFAAYRIAGNSDNDEFKVSETAKDSAFEENSMWIETVMWTVVLSVVVKYGELMFDIPFDPNYSAAAVMVLVPTAVNALKWSARSNFSSIPSFVKTLFIQ